MTAREFDGPDFRLARQPGNTAALVVAVAGLVCVSLIVAAVFLSLRGNVPATPVAPAQQPLVVQAPNFDPISTAIALALATPTPTEVSTPRPTLAPILTDGERYGYCTDRTPAGQVCAVRHPTPTPSPVPTCAPELAYLQNLCVGRGIPGLTNGEEDTR